MGEATQGLIMVDIGTAINLLTKNWVDTHGLTMKEKAADYISGANSTSVRIVGMTSITLLLMPTVELEVAVIVVCSGNFYQGLLGCNLLCGNNKTPSAATITLSGPD